MIHYDKNIQKKKVDFVKMSQLRRLANVDQHVTVSELKAGIHDILREKGYDMSSLYQEMEMDSLFIDTHDDRSTTADTVQLHSHLFYEILYCRSSGLEYLLGTRRYQVQKGSTYFYVPLDPSMYSVVYLKNEEGKVVREAVDEGTYTIEVDLTEAARSRYRLVDTSYSFTVKRCGHYDDVESAAWYSVPVERAYNLYYLSDNPENLFRPYDPLLRCEALGLLRRMTAGLLDEGADD